MVEGCAFGWMLGVGRRLFVIPSPLLFALAPNKEALVAELWESSGRRGVGLLALLDLSMIEKWMRLKVSFKLFKTRDFSLTKMI